MFIHLRKLITAIFFCIIPVFLSANTSIIVTSGASIDGSVMMSYTRDSNVLGGFMFFSESEEYPRGSEKKIASVWDEREIIMSEVKVRTGTVSHSPASLRITGHMNEKQVAIGDSSFTPAMPDVINFYGSSLDTGNLIELTLERSSTAREAILNIQSLTEEYGFYGPGKSLSITDKNEAWIMEMFSRGSLGKGIVWVARKIPDGYISGHADSARITTFPLSDSENCLYSEDIIDYARNRGLWDGSDEKFSFADVYTPVTSTNIKQTEGRLWSIYRKINSSMDDFRKYISGDIQRNYSTKGTANGIISNRLPLWIKPEKKLSSSDLMTLMRDHYEGTDMNMSNGIWAGPFGNPYRLRPDNATAREYFYNHERPVSIQYTGYSFITQSRNFLPDEIGGVTWFGVDDTYMTVYLPVYCGALGVPSCFSGEKEDITVFSLDSAYWLFNLVSNFSSLRYNKMIIDIQKVQLELENQFMEYTGEIEAAALKISDSDSDRREYLTNQSQLLSNLMMEKWYKLFQFLMVKYKDGEVRLDSLVEFKKDYLGYPYPTKIYGYPADWAQAMIDKDNPPDLKAIYSDDELMDLFARNNKNSILVISLVFIIVLLALVAAILSIKYYKISRLSRRE